ncbi:succinylglutamate desuccinylase/aspartoacylase family protein [Deltaproteobacteria bacterium OttesenSCG-928-K17]|nr:succinylglutamate desuccinylase/aspartoacylase family protein [Deltaproteobacteria bacterium OttesenSCG-928-K17]
MIPLPKPGQKLQFTYEVKGLPGLPMTFIGGLDAAGPTVLIAAGVHGGEYAAILTLVELARELQPSMLQGRLMMIHPLNTQGFWERRATVLPEDGRNINSLFAVRGLSNPFPAETFKQPPNCGGVLPLRGCEGGYKGPAGLIAEIAAGLQAASDFYLDLHAADLFETTGPLVCYPATGSAAVTEASRKAAAMVDAPVMIKSTLAGAGITEAARRGLPALLIKRGGHGGACLRAEVELYKKDVRNVLAHLGLLNQPPSAPLNPPEEIEPFYLRAKCQGLWMAAEAIGQKVKAGQTLGAITDFFGEPLETLAAEKDGRILYGLAALSVKAGDVLLVY